MSIINSPTIIDKAAAIQLLDGNSKPVIFWDTCSLLDIIRLPLPERKQSIGRLENIMKIRQKIVSGDIISLASILTQIEFNEHVMPRMEEVNRAARRISDDHNKFLEFINKTNPTVPLVKVDLEIHKIEDLLSDIVQDIAQATIFVNFSDDFMKGATNRVFQKTPPAKVKGEFKDCYIWLTCLEVRKGSQKTCNPFGFLSSNTTDYSDSTGISFDPFIDVEAGAEGIIYYPNFDIAFGQLRTAGVF